MQDIQGKNESRERTVDLLRLGQVLWKRAWIIILVAVLVGAVALVGSKLFMTPLYKSNFTAYVNNRQSTAEGQSVTNSGDITASRNLTYLYEEIIVSRTVLLDAAEDCGMTYSYSQLRSMVKTSVSTTAAIINVTVEAEDPRQAQQLAAAIAVTASEHVERIVDGSSMRIVDAPVLPTAPFAPNCFKIGLIGGLIALVVCALAVILFDVIVDKVNAPRELTERHGLAVMGVIPDMLQADKFTHTAPVSGRRK